MTSSRVSEQPGTEGERVMIGARRVLSLREIEAVADGRGRVALDERAVGAIAAARSAVAASVERSEAVYGINTGFGSLSRRRIDGASLRELQRNLVRSHAAGAGSPLPVPVVRSMMLLLAASLSRGRSGVRAELIEALVGLLNEGVTPVVPELGSVGASGDLAPLAHVALVLIGEGEAVLADGRVLAGGEALLARGLRAVELEAKEGLALINGTHLMAARMALLCARAERVFAAAVCAAAMSIEACRATDAFLDPRVYEVRNHAGPALVASLMRAMLSGSQITASHREDDPRVQDPYSFRCAPIVLGSVRQALDDARARLDDELGAVTDNPLIFIGDRVGDGAADEVGVGPAILSAGNFHGMPIAMPLDFLAIAIAHLAGIAERRVYHMLSAFDEMMLLTPYLSPRPGLHSGYMIVQYTAAAMCNELIGLATPASVANLTTCAGMEDYNSFGPRAAAKAERALDLAAGVVAIELLCAAQGMEQHRPLRSGDLLERAHASVRSAVPPLDADRPPAPEIAVITRMVLEGAFGGGAVARGV